MRIGRTDYSNRFVKEFKKAPLEVKIAFRDSLEIFLTDKFHPLLNNHALVGKFKGYRSIDVTVDWRAIFREFREGEIIYFDAIGTHDVLYKSS